MQARTVRLAVATAIPALAFAVVSLVHTPEARACGCFAPPDPSVPVVQAGERIVFAVEDGVVTAHIQVQYSGPAEEFGWLLPFPSVPEISVGTDELFSQVIQTTQPKYRLNRVFNGNCSFAPGLGGFGSASDAEGGGDGDGDRDADGGALVFEDTVGPFDVAVLRADSKDEMFTWLSDNDYFIPAGTDDVVDGYIRPGAFFLALKLQKGKDVGDLQPVVAKYPSDLPGIPIILTSVGADPDMAVQVWVLGESRAIPRNFFHTRINDARIDWLQSGSNYADVVTNAVDEANGHHSFVTEYAGSTRIMDNLLDYPGRFGDEVELRAISDPISFVDYLNGNGYAVQGSFNPIGFPQYSSQLKSILGGHIPLPQALANRGVIADDFYFNISYWLGAYRDANPEDFADFPDTFDPIALTREIVERVIAPTREAAQLFTDNPYMTRMFTTLSPHEMVKDPVFSFNRDLPDVSNIHEATGTYHCGLFGSGDILTTPFVIETEQGFELEYPDGTGTDPFGDIEMPWSWLTQVLREEGSAENVDDNTGEIRDALDNGGCGCSTTGSGGAGSLAMVLLLGLVFRRRRS